MPAAQYNSRYALFSRDGMVFVTERMAKSCCMKHAIIYCGICITLFITCCDKKKDKSNNATAATLKDTVLTSQLNHPWEILWGPDNFIWMTERNGKISRVNPATGAVIPLLTLTEVTAQG